MNQQFLRGLRVLPEGGLTEGSPPALASGEKLWKLIA
jgi:hypothetical protein